MNNLKILIFLCLALFLFFPGSVLAAEFKTGDSIYIGKNEIVSGNLFAAGSNITIDGQIDGDVFCAAQTININGRLTGDVFCAAQTININGEIAGSVRAAGNSININGKIGHNAMGASASFILGKDSEIGWDAIIAGAVIDARGKIKRNLLGAGASFNLSGEIGNDVKLKIDQGAKPRKNAKNWTQDAGLNITADAVIGGNINYTSQNEIKIAEGAQIKGEVIRYLPKQIAYKHRTGLKIWSGLIGFFSALVVGSVMISLFRKQVVEITDLMQKKYWPSIGWGAVKLFLAPIALIILMITIISIPLVLILFALWLIAIYVGKILVGILIGRLILEKFYSTRKDSLLLAMISGILILSILSAIPFIGWFICLLAVIYGLGGIALYCRKIA